MLRSLQRGLRWQLGQGGACDPHDTLRGLARHARALYATHPGQKSTPDDLLQDQRKSVLVLDSAANANRPL